jgi:hypothetical protein
VTLTAGTSTCPTCDRTWTVTPSDDCMVPACGCFGSDTSADNLTRPCDSCGTRHAWTCPKVEGHAERSVTLTPRRVEILPSGRMTERERYDFRESDDDR